MLAHRDPTVMRVDRERNACYRAWMHSISRLCLWAARSNCRVRSQISWVYFQINILSMSSPLATNEVKPTEISDKCDIQVRKGTFFLPMPCRSFQAKQNFRKNLNILTWMFSTLCLYLISGWRTLRRKLTRIRWWHNSGSLQATLGQKKKSCGLQEVCCYWDYRDKLHVQDGLVFRSNKLIIPAGKRREVLSHLHAAHGGTEMMKARARSVMYWPGINSNIEELAKTCSTCQKLKPRNEKLPMPTTSPVCHGK